MNSSSDFLTWLVEGPMSAKQFCTVTLNNTFLVYIFNVNTIDDKLKCSQRLLLCPYSMQRRDLTPFLLHFFLFLLKKLFTRTQYPDSHDGWLPRLLHVCTVLMSGRKSRTLELLAFDEYCRFDTSAFFYEIKRGSLYFVKESRSIKTAIFIDG